MADTQKQEISLGVLVTGTNPDDINKQKTITLKVPNPRDNLTSSDFTTDVKTFFATSAKASGKVNDNNWTTETTGAYREIKTSVSLDLTPGS